LKTFSSRIYYEDEAAKFKVNATPTVMINGLKLSGRSIESYKARIDGLLKSADVK